MNIAIVTMVPSPYQVELFDALRAAGILRPRVIYQQRRDAGRLWEDPRIRHDHVFLDGGLRQAATGRAWVLSADLTVFSGYGSPLVRALMRERAASGRPWCFWGERPGARNWGMLGCLYRRWHLHCLHAARAPIWGVGQWGLEGWRREFGENRLYLNVPYCSNLRRFFAAAARGRPTSAPRRFLYCGELSERKGVRLLTDAFVRLVAEGVNARLDFLGPGALEPLLRRRCAPLGDCVRFLGFQQWHALPRFYHDADILCVPSRYDGWAMTVVEGLAAGLPVITTDRTGAGRELICSGRNGWRIRAGDGVALHGALAEAAALPPDQLRQMAETARKSILPYDLGNGVRAWAHAAFQTCTAFQGASSITKQRSQVTCAGVP